MMPVFDLTPLGAHPRSGSCPRPRSGLLGDGDFLSSYSAVMLVSAWGILGVMMCMMFRSRFPAGRMVTRPLLLRGLQLGLLVGLLLGPRVDPQVLRGGPISFRIAQPAQAAQAAQDADAVAAEAATRRMITVQSTTSTENSGLLAYLFPLFTEASGYPVRTVAVGTGQAMRNAARGDGDLLLVHAKADELAFVAAGDGLERFDLMYNDFVLVGPRDDPAGVASVESAGEALRRLRASSARFMSRGDDSGTHKMERRLWEATGIDPAAALGKRYWETGSGMGATLNITAAKGSYTLSDRATWIAFANKRDLTILFGGDPMLFNQYGVIVVNPDRHPGVNVEGAQALSEWLRSQTGQAAIADFKLNGEQLFYPNAQNSLR